MRTRCLALAMLGVFGCTTMPAPPHQDRGTPELIGSDDANDPLTLAAECLARGDHAAAAAQFEKYVRLHPEQLMFRLHLAELLFKIHRVNEAKFHFERFIADAQDSTGPPKDRLVHCHTRLMEIANLTDDHFAELLHRGIGLLILTRQESDEAEIHEEILCKALKALREAAEVRPADPRVQVYLAEAYERLGNSRAAVIARAAARNFAAPGTLTPSEARSVATK